MKFLNNKKFNNQGNLKASFLFIDEVGISLDKNQKYFGIGGLEIMDTIELNRKLHDIFTGAVSFLHQKEERFEFKFKHITHNSSKFYQEIIKTLAETSGWQFKYILKQKDAPWGKTTFWEQYLEDICLLTGQFSERGLIVVSDFLSKPKNVEKDLPDTVGVRGNVINILQLESQGSLLLQVADILLGGVAYQKRVENGLKTDDLKTELSNSVMKLLANKKEQL